MTKNQLRLVVLLGAIVVLLIALIYFFCPPFSSTESNRPLRLISPESPVACTMEAKICPDGSAVGRTGANCEFAACPAVNDSITLKFPAEYISAQSWPPKISLSSSTVDGTLDCPATPETDSRSDRIYRRTVGSRIYCISAHSEGAAGSVYTDYIYNVLNNNRLVTAEFTLRYPQCQNFSEPQQTQCATERTNFNLDTLIDQMIETAKN